MNRDAMIQSLGAGEPFDILIIGGGATGLGCAIDGAARGYRVCLVEQHDFAKGTSSRSTKLVHGGVRYLQQGNISLVMEALRERGILRQNAPHLVRDLPFVVPNYDWWEAPFYGVGMRVYDVLAGRYGFGSSRVLSKEETIARLPTIETEGLRGGVVYHDGQFDDARLAINMAATAWEQGAALVNYARVNRLLIDNGYVTGAEVIDEETGQDYPVHARAVINATGVFADSVRRMENPGAKPIISPSQGVHIVLGREFLGGDSAIMVPHTSDGRVLFAIPWHDVVVVGTTDTPVDEIQMEPLPFDEEIDFLMSHAAKYMTHDPAPEDVRSVFVGLRPLVGGGDDENTSALSRDHTIKISDGGMITIAGGKWTTYRKMAQDCINQASVLAGLPEQPCPTKALNIHGYHQHAETFGELAIYGHDATEIRALQKKDPRLAERLHPDLPITGAEVIWAAREEMARTVEDVLARRTRMLLLNAKKSIEVAPKVAELLAEELDRDAETVTSEYDALAAQYVL